MSKTEYQKYFLLKDYPLETPGFQKLNVVDRNMFPQLEKELSRFVSDTKKFNKVLQKTGAVVSGSSMLGVLIGESYDTDLDIVINCSELYEMRHFLNEEGYEISRYQGGRNLCNGSWFYIAMQKQVEKSSRTSGAKYLKIDLCIMFDKKPSEHVALYDMTCVMNYWDGADFYSAFPDMTQKMCTYYRKCKWSQYLRNGTDDVIGAIRLNKYKHRGFSIKELTFNGTDLSFCGLLLSKENEEVSAATEEKYTATEEKDATAKGSNQPEQKLTKYEAWLELLREEAKTQASIIVDAFRVMTNEMRLETEVTLTKPVAILLRRHIEKDFFEQVDWPKDAILFKWSETMNQVNLEIVESLVV